MFMHFFTQWKYRINIVKTLYFNLHYFSWKTAIHFPILIANNVIFRNLKGTVVINASKLKTGMIRIGFRDMGIQDEKRQKTILDVRQKGELIFDGNASIGGGARVYIKGRLIIGDNFYLSLNSQLIAHELIKFEKNCTVGWDVLVMDTDFHTVMNYNTNEVYSMTKPILIGEHCWICNGSQLLKGTILPDDCIVGAMSLCNSCYETSHSLIAGIPAVVKKTNITHAR